MIDLGFTGLPVDRAVFDATVIRDMRMVAIFPADGAELPDVVTPADLARYPLVATQQRSNTRAARPRLDARGRPRSAAGDGDRQYRRDQAGGLPSVSVRAIVPEVAITLGAEVEGLVHRPLDPPIALTLALIRRRNKADDLGLRIVCDAIMSLAEPPAPAADRMAG